ncbi:hypothetical protein ARD30_10045 [Bosea thiooxidans]|uniref:DUF2000 domain-containing protein n=1 Tax=Bosea thiooxidans TaxID=53254 RepID=A0A0Q3T0G8_9HYPH|nr:DUF2000 family protein [Bosea thiooxidans]KQK31170.1 hypothetical protein ARD30_10045 [Bosea thiooxidans]SKB62315.1 hypothetical protein SAMN05660750_01599 [Bosea thiooxidans]
MRYDTKIAIVVRENLATWQKLNVASFLAGGLVGAAPEISGEPYRDGSGRFYGPLVRQPVLIFAATSEELKQVLQRAQGRGVRPHLYTNELFATGNDSDNRAAVAAVATADLDLVGLGLHAERKEIDKIVKGLKLHG